MDEVYLNPEIASIVGEQDPFLFFDRLQGKVYRQVASRRTLRVKLDGQVLFLKRHHGVGWLEILKNLLSLRLPVLGAGHEFRAARALSAAGVRVPEPVAYAERGSNPAARESFLVSRAVEPSVSLEDVAKSWRQARPGLAERAHLIRAVADITQRMHNTGINHRDLYICHFLLRPDGDPQSPELSLIDLHRAQIRLEVPRRWLVKDLGALWFSTLDSAPTRRDALRFIRRYTGRTLRDELADPARAAFWRDVGERASTLRDEAERKGLAVFADPFARDAVDE